MLEKQRVNKNNNIKKAKSNNNIEYNQVLETETINTQASQKV